MDEERRKAIEADRRRTREAETRLRDDVIDILMWLDLDEPVSTVRIEKHYGMEDHELAYAIPLIEDAATRRHVRMRFEAALCALGWSVSPEGKDVRDFKASLRRDDVTPGQRQLARLRIESALAAYRASWPRS